MLDPQIPQKPGSIAPPSTEVKPVVAVKEPTIRTMPERYIGAPAGRPPVVREIIETKTVNAPPIPPPPAPKPKAPVKKSHLAIIIASIVVLLAGAGAVAYILLTPVGQTPPPPPINTNVPEENTNANENINVPPPAPVCGNAVLETGEECDDGNLLLGDGCSDLCKIEPKALPPPTSGVDSDSDGLTDAEETTVYDTDLHNPDTDGDSFNDGNEVGHLYDPRVKSPAMLKDSPVIRVVKAVTKKYSVMVPAKWILFGEDTAQFMATAPTGEFLQVLETDKPKDQSLVEWYLAMSPGTDQNALERIKTLGGYDALRSPDRLTTYVDAGDGRVLTLTLSFGDQNTLDYRTTYEMFVAGFMLLKP